MNGQKLKLSLKSTEVINLNELCEKDDRFKAGSTEIRITHPEIVAQLIQQEQARQNCWEITPSAAKNNNGPTNNT